MTTGAGAGVSTTTGAGGGGVSTITGAGGGGTGVVSTITGAGAGVSATVTVDFGFSGMMLTFVFNPVAEALPVEPTELLVYTRPLLSTFAGPEMMAGVLLAVVPCAFAGAGAVPTTVPLDDCACAVCSVRISPVV